MPGVVMNNNLNQQDDAKSITHFLSRVFRKVVRLVIGTVSLPASRPSTSKRPRKNSNAKAPNRPRVQLRS
jgi:hypothetical protein